MAACFNSRLQAIPYADRQSLQKDLLVTGKYSQVLYSLHCAQHRPASSISSLIGKEYRKIFTRTRRIRSEILNYQSLFRGRMTAARLRNQSTPESVIVIHAEPVG